jgi:hypothetical protein
MPELAGSCAIATPASSSNDAKLNSTDESASDATLNGEREKKKVTFWSVEVD